MGSRWRWDRWAQSGNERFQGGTLNGVRSKLNYLGGLGITALWLSPVMRQRRHANTFGSNTYHGYGVADFLEVDPRFGTRQDLVDLVDAAHQVGIKIILDVIFNHTGQNWNYPGNIGREDFLPWPAHYTFGNWLGAAGEPIQAITSTDQGAWPLEFQDPARYTRAGSGDLGKGSNDHDQLSGIELRFTPDLIFDHQVMAPVADPAVHPRHSYDLLRHRAGAGTAGDLGTPIPPRISRPGREAV
jgi:hypothetical protein